MAQQGPKKELLVKEFERIGKKADELIIHAPGILALGDESLLPPSGSATDSGGVLCALRFHGDVVTTTYPTYELDPGYIARQLADMIDDGARRYRRVNIIGSSMGGLLAVDALARLTDPSLAPMIRSILVDSPFGARDLMSGGNIAAPVLRWMRLGQLPLLQLDMWEHAFYLDYLNVKADYVKAAWNIAHWENVAQRFAAARESSPPNRPGSALQRRLQGRHRFPVRKIKVQRRH